MKKKSRGIKFGNLRKFASYSALCESQKNIHTVWKSGSNMEFKFHL